MNHSRFSVVNMNPFVFADAISEGHLPCDDFAFTAMPVKDITDAVACLVALVLRDRELKVEEEASVCGRRVKVLLRAFPKYVMLIKDFLDFVVIGDIPKPTIEALE